MEELNKEDLKAQADSLGIKYSPNIGLSTLKDRIDAKLNADDSGELDSEIEAVVETPRVNKRVDRPVDAKLQKRRDIVQRAKKRSKVIIYNNDPKESEFSTTFSSVRNSFFGDAKVLPLGKEWWVAQMHIDNLRSIPMIRFEKDREGNAIAKQGKKFTIDIIETDEEAAKARLAKQAKS